MKHLTSIVLLTFAFNATSQTIITEAPSVSASAVTVPKNGFQIESTLTFSSTNEFAPYKSYTFGMPTALFRFGLFEKFELRATGTFNIFHNDLFIDPTRYKVRDIGIGAKYEILNKPEGKTQMAVIAHFNFWNQDNPYKASSIDYALNHNFNDRHSVGFNLGTRIDWRANNDSFSQVITTFRSSLIYNFSVNDKITLFGEVYGATAEWAQKSPGFEYKSGFQNSFGADLGILYLLRDNIQLDAAFGASLDGERFNGSLGFNILLNSKKK
jgi:hypothetical protein